MLGLKWVTFSHYDLNIIDWSKIIEDEIILTLNVRLIDRKNN